MTKEQQKDKIIEIVKKAIDNNTIVGSGEVDIIELDCNDVDHIAEKVAEEVCCQGLAVEKVKRFLFVEDGSVDTDELGRQLENNPEIAIVVYRQGSMLPQLVDVKEHGNDD